MRWQWALAVTVAWAVALAVRRAVRRVEGSSMAPAFVPGQRVLVVPAMRVVRRGDVVIVQDPRAPQRTLLKRVRALPGDVVDGFGQVPAGHVWVLGDDPAASTDSRVFGPVARTAIVGRVALWPWALGPRRRGTTRAPWTGSFEG